MIDEVCDKFCSMWSPNQQMIVDEGMIMYKGKYCLIRQYMPKKPIRFGLKVWAAADALSKYLWDFEVYCGKSGNPHDEDNMNSNDDSDAQYSHDEEQSRPGRGGGVHRPKHYEEPHGQIA
jgi:hypothetical protein